MAQDFYDLLYDGYTGEYQLMSSLYRHGLDALRPPADMGIDVVSLNLKLQLKGRGVRPEMFFFQVKTVMTDFCESPEHHGAIRTVEFKLKESELELIEWSKSRAIFCYVYNNKSDSLTDVRETPFMCFWLDGYIVGRLRRANAFFRKEGESKMTLACQLRKPARENSHWYAVVVDENDNTVECGYLGVVGGEGAPAPDDADHYSVGGYLEYARRDD